MKTITGSLQTHLEGEVTTLATIWRVTRTDGVEFFFTDHDVDITFESNVYTSSVGYNRSAVDSKTGLSVDNLDVLGFLDSSALTETDLRGGKFDFAEIRIGIVNYADLSQGQLRMRRGTLGEVTYSDVTGTFMAELRGLTQLYSQGAVELYQAECRADLGDSRCKVAISPTVMAANTAYALETNLRGSTLLNLAAPYALLLNFDADANDRSSVGATGTLGTEAALQTTQAQFGAGAIEFSPTATVDPSEAFVSYPDNAAYTIETSPFTIECWVRFKDLTSTDQVFMSHYESGTNNRGWYFSRSGSNLEFGYSPDGSFANLSSVDGAFTWAIDTWYHVAVTRDASNNLRLFVDGTQVGTDIVVTTSIFDAASVVYIGKRRSNGGDDIPLNGFVDDARILVGEALYTENFTPPVAAGVEATTVLAALTTPDFNDRFFEVTTPGTTGFQFPVFNTTIGGTTTWGTAVLTTREAFNKAVTVASVTDNRTFTVTFPNGDDTREIDDWFKYGAVVWESGDNNGLAMEVKSYTAATNTVELFLPMSFTVQVGDTGYMYAGCDRQKDTCVSKFDNIFNFRGEPYVPGQDEFLTYPNAR
ncbi:gp84 [Alphaproteobacteria phage PhiJL001]|uniref:Gp84 n=1 Tax=Alphaproteobacteria phage PhiJL001 TaxID=2681607 RepID=Q5DN21_9CAUD|nr:tail assembly protein [Alphaproteobacteria phage PhiJL001]AAT69466.1 gp84 [Alphaproteobacteria phage PhiJL001]